MVKLFIVYKLQIRLIAHTKRVCKLCLSMADLGEEVRTPPPPSLWKVCTILEVMPT